MDTERPAKALAASSVNEVMQGLDEQLRSGAALEFRDISTGFRELDVAVGGGLKAGQLVLLGGHPGVGKTTLALQMARNMAASGQVWCLYVCFEHEPGYMVQRLISMESVGTSDGMVEDGLRLKDIAELVNAKSYLQTGGVAQPVGLREVLSRDARGARALERLGRYAQSLLIAKGSSTATTTGAITEMGRSMRAQGERPIVVFVDYLQKLATTTPHSNESARNTEQVEGLKELALGEQILVVAIVAADSEGVRAQRLRLGHFLSTPAVVYEADVVMIMNEEYNILDQHHVAYNPHKAEQLRNSIVLSLEKNRAGSDLIDLEFHKQLHFCSFKPHPRRVKESLL